MAIRLCFFVVLLFAPPAVAHEPVASHTVVVEARSKGKELHIQALLTLELSEGQENRAMVARFDTDLDGELNELEGRMLAAQYGDRVVGGYLLEFGPRATGKGQSENDIPGLAPVSADGKASLSPGGHLSIAVLLTYPPQPLKDQRLQVRVLDTPVGKDSTSPALRSQIQLAPPLLPGAASHTWAKDAAVLGPVTLLAGGAAVWADINP